MKWKKWLMAICFLFLFGGMTADVTAVHAEDEPWICLVDENGVGIGIKAAEDQTGVNWSYKAATKTLTLNGFHGRELDILSEELCIFLEPGTVNVLEGDYIPLHVKEDVNKKLVITGGGTLELNVTDNAALIAMNLELQGGRVIANNEVYCIETAVISGGSLEISREMNPVLTVNNELTISGGSVKVVGAENDYYALMSKKNLTVSGGELYVESGNAAIAMIEEGTFRMDGGSVCLKALGEGVNGRETHVQMNGGKLDIEAGGWCGMTVSDMVMTGGTLTIEAEMRGLEMEKSLVATGGNVEISVTEEDGNPITPADFNVDKSVNMNLSGGNCSGFISGIVGGEQVGFLLYKEPAYLYDYEDSYYQALESTYYNRIYQVDWSGMTIEENERKSREIDAAFIEDWTGISLDGIDGYYMLNMIDITNPYQVDLSGGAEITFPADGILEGDNIVVLHLKSDGTWERIPAVAGNGMITGTFTSLSPVCYAKLVVREHKYVPADIAFTGEDGSERRWISSEQSGTTSISGSQTVIPEGAGFEAEKVSYGTSYEEIARAVEAAKGDVEFVIYDFSLSADDSEMIQFDGYVDISMLLSDVFELADGQTVSVYYYNNGKLEKCDTAVSDGFVTFATKHTGRFVYIQESEAMATSSGLRSPKTGEDNMAFYVALLAIAAFGGAVYGICKAGCNSFR